MEENRKMEFRIPCQIADQREAGESRSDHDAVCPDFLRLVSTVEHLQAVSRAVGDVHALLACLFLRISQRHDALEHSFFERSIILIHERMVVLDDRAAAKSELCKPFQPAPSDSCRAA